MPFQTFSLHQLGWRPQYAHASTLDDFEACYPARVTAVRRGSVALLSSRGAGTAALAWQLAGAGIVPGDWVMVERASGRVTGVLP
ncbi:MAG TPA: ribosome small subunit-dependent GTPase A, partial [Rhodanobacter sp.]|nr:ribosome small subunit-dependent GTPase A [Rhodanobacter sp.]